MFPDPEAYNPMRWLDPSYPTFKEDLTVNPTITNYSQFGYGRRVCQGQGVTEADMFVGVGAMAWLFNIAKEDIDHVETDSAYESGDEKDMDAEGVPHEPNVSSEKSGLAIDTGIQTPPNEKSIAESLSSSWGYNVAEDEAISLPGAFPEWAIEIESRFAESQTPPTTPVQEKYNFSGSLDSIRANCAPGKSFRSTVQMANSRARNNIGKEVRLVLRCSDGEKYSTLAVVVIPKFFHFVAAS
jgi:hypothetical protein